MAALWDTIKLAGKQIRATGNPSQYLGAAAKGAAIMAGVSGVTEWSQGGSFWSGAKSGLVSGAIAGAGYRAAKVGALGNAAAAGGSIGEAYDSYKGAYGAVKGAYTDAGYATKNATDRELFRKGLEAGDISKQVKVIMEQKGNATLAATANGLYKK